MKTTDYSKFKFIGTNRIIQNGLVERLKQSITKIGYIEARPILVNEDYEIIDGQNRFVACKELQIPIVYSIMKRNGITDDEIIAELNKNQLVWRLQDFIHHFAQQGVKYHSVIREFEDKYKLGISNSIVLCSKVNHNTKHIRNGDNSPLNSKRDECAEFVLGCKDLFFYKNKCFVNAVKELFNKGNKEHIEKLKLKHLQIPQQPAMSSYCNVFGNIINRHRPDNSKIIF